MIVGFIINILILFLCCLYYFTIHAQSLKRLILKKTLKVVIFWDGWSSKLLFCAASVC
jgi:hypothetical protein